MARGYLPDIPFDLWAQDQSQQFEQYTQQQDEAQKFREQTADINAPAVGTWPDPYEVLARPQPDPEPFYSPAPPAQDTTSPVPDDGVLPSPDAMAQYYGLPSAGDSGPNDFLPPTAVQPAQPDDGGADFTPHPTYSASSLLPSPDEMAQQYGLESPSGTDRPNSSSPVDPSAGAAAPQEAEGFLPQFTKAVGSAVGSTVKGIFGDRDSGLTGALNSASSGLANTLNSGADKIGETLSPHPGPAQYSDPFGRVADAEGANFLPSLPGEALGALGQKRDEAVEATRPYTLAGIGRETAGIQQVGDEGYRADLARLQDLLDRLDAGDEGVRPEIEALSARMNEQMGATRDAEASTRAVQKVGEERAPHTLENLGEAETAAATLALTPNITGLIGGARASLPRQAAAAALDPIGQATGATFETGLGLAGRGLGLAGRAAEEAAPLVEDAARALGQDAARTLDEDVAQVVDTPPASTFFSQLRRTVEEKMPNRAAPQQVEGILRGSPVKPDELKWTGFDDFLAQAKAEGRQVTKQEALDFLDQNAVRVEEVVQDTPRYGNYQLPGGENYRELLLTLPPKETRMPSSVVPADGEFLGFTLPERTVIDPVYRSSHWDEPNVLAHVRFNDRVDAEGKRVLFVEEVQSDWHQAGREHGYRLTPAEEQRALEETGQIPFSTGDASAVPAAPFAKTWPELAMKRVIRWAAENGYDRVAWTTGEQQAKRYPAGGEQGEKIGGGMAAFYDSILPNTVNKLGKKFGARVRETEIPTMKQGYRLGDNGVEEVRDTWRVPAIDITPQMRAGVVGEGQPLFSAVPGLGGGLAGAASEDTLDEEDQSPQDRALRTGLGFAAGMAFRKNKPDPRLLHSADPSVAAYTRMFHEGTPEIKVVGDWEKLRRSVVEKVTDRLVNLGETQNAVQKEAEARGYIFGDADRALEWARVNASASARQRLQEIEDRVLDLVDRDGLRDAWRNVVVARHQLDQEAQFPGRTFPGGDKAPDVTRRLTALEADVRARPDGDTLWDKVTQAADNTAAYTQDLLKERHEAGIISDELYNDLTAKYPRYIPTKILKYIDDVSDSGMVSTGKRFTLGDQGIRKLTEEGTDKEMQDPLKALALLTLSTKQQVRKNNIFNAAWNWVDKAPDAFGQWVQKVNANVDYDHRTHMLLPGWVDGTKQHLLVPKDLVPVFIDPTIGQAGPGPWNTWMSLFTGMVTRKFPAFALVGNPVLDLSSYTLRTGTLELSHALTTGNVLTRVPRALVAYPKVMAELGRALPDVFEGLGKGRFYGDVAAMREAGGGMAGWFGHGLEDLDKIVKELGYSPIVLSDPGSVAHAIKDVLAMHPVENLGERLELLPRVAAYRRGLARGETELQAMIRGREATIDFATGGTFTKFLGQGIPFLNVGVQAPMQVYRLFHDNPVAATATIASMVVAPTVAVEAWNRSDPERAKAYARVPQSLKDRGLVMISPSPWTTNREGEQAPNVIFLPGREWAPFVNVTRHFLTQAYGDDTQSWGDLIKNGVLPAMSPVQAANGMDLINGLLPPPVDVIGSLAYDIDPYSGGKLSSKFRAERAGPTAQIATELLNKGLEQFGHKATAGQTEYAMRNTLGGVGQMVTAGADLLLQNVGGRYRVPTSTESNPTATRIQDTPLVGGLVGRFYRQAEGGDLEQARGAKVSEGLDKALSASGVSYRPADMAPSALNVPLTRQELARTQDLANRYFEASARDWMGRAGWDQRSAAEKDQIIRALATAAHQRAGAEVVRDIQSSERSRRTAAGER